MDDTNTPQQEDKKPHPPKKDQLKAKDLLKGAILHERLRTEPLKQTGENKEENP